QIYDPSRSCHESGIAGRPSGRLRFGLVTRRKTSLLRAQAHATSAADWLPPDSATLHQPLCRNQLRKTGRSILAAVCAAGLWGTLATAIPVRAGDSDSRGTKAEPGVTYSNDRVTRVPWSIHVVKIDRSRKDLGFFSSHARDRVLGVSLISDQARAIPREI